MVTPALRKSLTVAREEYVGEQAGLADESTYGVGGAPAFSSEHSPLRHIIGG